MIKRLKYRFILINFSLLFSILLVILGGTYYLMTKVGESQSIKLMENVAQTDGLIYKSPPSFPDNIKPGTNKYDNYKNYPFDQTMKKNSFSVLLDMNNQFIQLNSHYENQENIEDMSDLISITLTQNKEQGTLTYNDIEFRFLIQNRPYGRIIVFFDRSSEIVSASQLAIVLLMIGGPSLIVLFILSVFLASWAIKPVDKAWQKQKQFVADASHELKTPLAVISTTTEVILGNPLDTVKNQEKWLTYIQSETERMSKLVSNLLYLAKVDSHELSTSNTSFNFSETIVNTALPLEALMFEAHQELDLQVEPNLYMVGEEESLTQVLIILLDNAMKHCSSNGKITISLSKQDKFIKLDITNTGIGIEREHLDKIFERFYRVDDSRHRETGGYGLGLAIAKSIVTQHHGTITASSVLNEQTTFTVLLPLKH